MIIWFPTCETLNSVLTELLNSLVPWSTLDDLLEKLLFLAVSGDGGYLFVMH